jgi:hypothetical protein
MCMISLLPLHPPSERLSEYCYPADRQGYTRGDTHELEVASSVHGRPFCFRGVKWSC